MMNGGDDENHVAVMTFKIIVIVDVCVPSHWLTKLGGRRSWQLRGAGRREQKYGKEGTSANNFLPQVIRK